MQKVINLNVPRFSALSIFSSVCNSILMVVRKQTKPLSEKNVREELKTRCSPEQPSDSDGIAALRCW
jgi:hypothetical protein